jgi:hypothetical protein
MKLKKSFASKFGGLTSSAAKKVKPVQGLKIQEDRKTIIAQFLPTAIFLHLAGHRLHIRSILIRLKLKLIKK